MYCDHCDDLVDENVNGGVRLKLGKKEYVFHLCGPCQELLKKDVKEVFLEKSEWREI
jgi:RNase P subunit RPR2